MTTTTTALARPQSEPSVPIAAPIAWDQELRGAQYLFKSGLCPASIKSPEAALFIILAGRDLGLAPVAALRNIHVIQGKVEVSADMQLALFARAGGSFRWVALSDTEAALELRAPWMAAPHVSRWTMQDAQRAKLDGGDNWKKYPKAMLRSRAITAGLKDVGFDATAGVYAPGEISGAEVVDVATGEVLSPEPVVEAPSVTRETPIDFGRGKLAAVNGKNVTQVRTDVLVWWQDRPDVLPDGWLAVITEELERRDAADGMGEISAEAQAREAELQAVGATGELSLGDARPRRSKDAIRDHGR